MYKQGARQVAKGLKSSLARLKSGLEGLARVSEGLTPEYLDLITAEGLRFLSCRFKA